MDVSELIEKLEPLKARSPYAEVMIEIENELDGDKSELVSEVTFDAHTRKVVLS